MRRRCERSPAATGTWGRCRRVDPRDFEAFPRTGRTPGGLRVEILSAGKDELRDELQNELPEEWRRGSAPMRPEEVGRRGTRDPPGGQS